MRGWRLYSWVGLVGNKKVHSDCLRVDKKSLMMQQLTINYTHLRRALYMYIYISGGPLSALTCCVNARLLSAIKKISPLIYSQSWDGSWVYTTQAMMTFTLIF